MVISPTNKGACMSSVSFKIKEVYVI